MYICVGVHIYIYVYVYTRMYRERKTEKESERQRERERGLDNFHRVGLPFVPTLRPYLEAHGT